MVSLWFTEKAYLEKLGFALEDSAAGSPLHLSSRHLWVRDAGTTSEVSDPHFSGTCVCVSHIAGAFRSLPFHLQKSSQERSDATFGAPGPTRSDRTLLGPISRHLRLQPTGPTAPVARRILLRAREGGWRRVWLIPIVYQSISLDCCPPGLIGKQNS